MQKTPLFDEHVSLGGRMVDFAGWSMPIQYPTGIPQEHLAVRQDAGIFDVSHMGEFRIEGADALLFLSYATLNDPAKLRPGQGQYTLLPNAHGGLVDDLYLYRDFDDSFLVVANASNVSEVGRHLEMLHQERGGDVRISDISHQIALIALQGPTAAVKLDRIVDVDLTTVKKNRLVDSALLGMPVRLARTGYTGEDGFEIFCAPTDAPAVWRSLLGAGAVACGLGARDTLRLEAGFPLYGHEYDSDSNPLCTPFAWVVKEKEAFGLSAMRQRPCVQQLVALSLEGRGIPREGYRILDAAGDAIGRVTSGTISPLTRRSIALGWVSSSFAPLGSGVFIEIRGQAVAATVTQTPFT